MLCFRFVLQTVFSSLFLVLLQGQIIDLMRYIWLAEEGGVYSDMDVDFRDNLTLDTLLDCNGSYDFVAAIEENLNVLGDGIREPISLGDTNFPVELFCNFFFATAPKSEVMETLVKKAVENSERWGDATSLAEVYQLTGPSFFARVFDGNNYRNNPHVRIVDISTKNKYLWHSGWGTWKGERGLYPIYNPGFFPTISLEWVNKTAYPVLGQIHNPPPSLCRGHIPRRIHFISLSLDEKPQLYPLSANNITNMPSWYTKNPEWQIDLHYRWQDYAELMRQRRLDDLNAIQAAGIKPQVMDLALYMFVQENGGLGGDLAVMYPNHLKSLEQLLQCQTTDSTTFVAVELAALRNTPHQGLVFGGAAHNPVMEIIIKRAFLVANYAKIDSNTSAEETSRLIGPEFVKQVLAEVQAAQKPDILIIKEE